MHLKNALSYKVRQMFPEANISPIDYDPGASESNQVNRIKLLMTVAKDNLALKQKKLKAIETENKQPAKQTEKETTQAV